MKKLETKLTQFLDALSIVGLVVGWLLGAGMILMGALLLAPQRRTGWLLIGAGVVVIVLSIITSVVVDKTKVSVL